MDPREGDPTQGAPVHPPDGAADGGTVRPAQQLSGLREVPAAELADLLLRAIGTASNAITIADARAHDLPLVYANRAFLELTGYPEEEVLGRNCRFLQGPGTDPGHARPIGRRLAGGLEVDTVLRNYRRDGTAFWNHIRISPVRDAAGEVTHFIGNQADVTDHMDKEQRSAYLAYHDELTGLANRPYVEEHLELEIRRAARTGAGVAVVYLDLEGFDDVSHRLGHTAGDSVLVQAARRLRAVLRSGDLVARLGGDQFVCVLPGLPPESAEPAEQVARHIADALGAPFVLSGEDLLLRASIGWTLYPRDAVTAAALLDGADAAMDRHKGEQAHPGG